MMVIAVACCWASGEIEIVEEVDGWADISEGVIDFARGEIGVLRDRIEARARHGYQPGILLVPGLPEFEDVDDPTDMSRAHVLMQWVQWAFADWPADMNNVRVQPALMFGRLQ